jgi:hypothetical protein
MKRLSSIILAFSVAFAIFVMGPPFLGYEFSPYPLMKIADIFDLFTPLVLIPLYWMLFRMNRNEETSLKENLIFIFFTSFWVLGKGMQLTANSIGHLTANMTGSDIYSLTYFYDEVLGHYLWHFGVIGLSALLIYHQWKNPFTKEIGLTWKNIPAGIIYGFTFFAMVVEGQTTLMGVPFAALVAIWCFILWRNKFNRQPLISLFLVGYLVATILFIVWGIWQHGLPEFTEVGII